MTPNDVAEALLTPANLTMLRQCLEAESSKNYPLSKLRGFIVSPAPTRLRERMGAENNGCPFIGIIRQEDWNEFLHLVHMPAFLQSQLNEPTKGNALRVLIVDDPIVLCCDVPIETLLTIRPHSFMALRQQPAEALLSSPYPTPVKNLDRLKR